MATAHAEYMREWRKRNPEVERATKRRYYLANKEKWIGKGAPKGSLLLKSQKFARNSRMRAKRWGSVGNVTPAELRAIYGKCFYCAMPSSTWDHCIPLFRGGANSIGNIVASCAACNNRKARRTVEEWRAGISVSYFSVETRQKMSVSAKARVRALA